MGFTALIMHAAPQTTSQEDVYTAEMFNQLHAGLVLAPVVYGDYPQAVKGLLKDKLPVFTDDEKQKLKSKFVVCSWASD